MILVSMTTTSSRIGDICPRVANILAGVRPPDRLVINLGLRPSHLSCQGVRQVPEDLTQLAHKHRQLEFRFTNNLGPATKLLPSLREQWDHKEQIIVTADDDVHYPPYWLANLVQYAEKYPDTLLCYTARGLKATGGYEQWPLVRRSRLKRPTLRHWAAMPRGHDGVLYRPGFFEREVFDIKRMLADCPSNDDLWFTAWRKPETPVRVIPSQGQFPLLRSAEPLYEQNKIANDKMIERIRPRLRLLIEAERRLRSTHMPDDEGLH